MKQLVERNVVTTPLLAQCISLSRMRPVNICMESSVYLLLGDLQDSCCLRVRDELEARNCAVRIVSNPLVHPWRFSWLLNNQESVSQLGLGEEPPVSNDQIAGVLVRSSGCIDPLDWEPEDLAYMQSEASAALLAWLWSLPCPVVNRYPAAIWYQPQCPLLYWQPLLQRCGLPIPETVVTNVEHEAQAFGRTAPVGGICGAVYGPISGAVRYLISSEEEWTGLASLQRVSPVCLAVPHGKTQLVCVVGERVIWNDEPSPDAQLLAPALRRFAAAAGLAFVELALAPTDEEMCVVTVEPHPQLEHFSPASRQEMVEEIVSLLTTEASDHECIPQIPQRRLL